MKFVGRVGCAQTIKVLACADLGKTSLDATLIAHTDSAAISKALEGSKGPITVYSLALTTDANKTVWDPNAAAKLVAGTPHPSIETVAWLEYEETRLRPAVYGSDAAALKAALAPVQEALKKHGGHLTAAKDKSLGLAEYVVGATLAAAPVSDTAALPHVKALLEALGQAWAKALSQATGGDAAVIQAVAASDRASLASSARRLPKKGERNILITSALPYVNNVPHLGNIIGCVLSADAYARFVRARGYNSIYVAGTDEYGTATETKALEEGLTCQEICDKYHAIHADIYKWFDIEFDHFGRTPTRQQTVIAQDIFKKLEGNHMLVENTMEQLYSEALGKFLADRYVVGTCPKCKYEDARGDQCDGCGNLLNPTELINPKCKFSGTTPVIRSTKHIFIDLPKLADELQEYVSKTSQLGGWTSNCLTTTEAWLRQGLKQRCITRDLKWGTPVPVPGYEDKVFYVWFDAPIGYISITANYTTEWEKWWKSPQDVELVQFMGKDNVPFHTVIFPSTLLGTKQPWTMMKNISVTEYLNYEGGKFSKSRGVGVFGSDAKDTGIPVEVWRYYLLVNRPENADTDFNWTDLSLKNNGELLNNLGNFINRTLSFVNSKYDGAVPSPASHPAALALCDKVGHEVSGLVDQYLSLMESVKLKDGLKTAMAVSRAANGFFQEGQAWVSIKTDRDHAATIIAGCVGLVGIIAALIDPFMPSVTRKITAQLGLSQAQAAALTALTADFAARTRSPQTFVPAGTRLGKIEPIFRTISEEEVEALRARFAGSQAERGEAGAPGAAAVKPGAAAGKAAAAAKAGKPAAAPKDKPAPKEGGDAAPKEKKERVERPTGEKKERPERPERPAGSERPERPAKADKSEKADGAPAAPKEKKSDKSAAAEKAEDAGEKADPSRLDLRVGRIVSVKRHPDADSLYVEEIELGDAAPRTVVSGLVKYIPIEDMQGRRVVCVCNLKPAKMRGVESQAMVLAATSADGSTVELLEPPEGAAVGERVTFEGFQGTPDEVLNPKRKVFETVSAEFSTRDDRVAVFRGLPFTTTAGPVTVKSVVGATVR